MFFKLIFIHSRVVIDMNKEPEEIAENSEEAANTENAENAESISFP